MGEVSPKERGLKNSKQKKGSKGSGKKYLKLGALAQLKYSKASSTKACTNLGRKRVAVVETKKAADVDLEIEDRASPLMRSPVNLVLQSSLLKTPKTPLMLLPVNQVKSSSLMKTPQAYVVLHQSSIESMSSTSFRNPMDQKQSQNRGRRDPTRPHSYSG